MGSWPPERMRQRNTVRLLYGDAPCAWINDVCLGPWLVKFAMRAEQGQIPTVEFVCTKGQVRIEEQSEAVAASIGPHHVPIDAKAYCLVRIAEAEYVPALGAVVDYESYHFVTVRFSIPIVPPLMTLTGIELGRETTDEHEQERRKRVMESQEVVGSGL